MNGSGECDLVCDEDQCQVNNGDCPVFSDCIDVCAGHECQCFDGFELDPYSNQCVLICDELQCATDPCGAHASCTELCDLYECSCDAGYESTEDTGACCEIVNQCETGDGETSPEDLCDENSLCVNDCDGFHCECEDGFDMVDGQCVDPCNYDMCDVIQNVCPNDHNCVPSCDSFSCVPVECPPDFCSSVPNSQVVVITETVYASTCACECVDGYEMQGGVCEEICDEDQCADNSICGTNSDCTDLCNGYECSCQTGYHPVQGSCVIDESHTSTYGDPHFHILGQSSSQPDLCFDYSGTEGEDLIILSDSKIKVLGALFTPHKNKKQMLFESIEIRSENGHSLRMTAESWKTYLSARPDRVLTLDNGRIGDFEIVDYRTTRKGISLIAKLDFGFEFEILTNRAYGNVNFRILNSTGLSTSGSGLLGQLLNPGAYTVVQEEGAHDAIFYYQNYEVEVKLRNHAWNKQCWVIPYSEAMKIFSK